MPYSRADIHSPAARIKHTDIKRSGVRAGVVYNLLASYYILKQSHYGLVRAKFMLATGLTEKGWGWGMPQNNYLLIARKQLTISNSNTLSRVPKAQGGLTCYLTVSITSSGFCAYFVVRSSPPRLNESVPVGTNPSAELGLCGTFVNSIKLVREVHSCFGLKLASTPLTGILLEDPFETRCRA